MTDHSESHLSRPEFLPDPGPHHDPGRKTGPVRKVDAPSGNVWVVTRFEEAKQVLADRRLSKNLSSLPGGPETARLPKETRQMMGNHMQNADPPEHTRLRQFVAKGFTTPRMETLRPRVQTIAAELLDRMVEEAEDRTAELLSAFAFPLPLTVLCELLGLPVADRDQLHEWTDTLTGGLSSREDILTTSVALESYLRDIVAGKRREPGDDLISEMLASQAGDNGISDDELLSTLFLLVVSGFETAAHLIGNGTYLLLTHPDQAKLLREDPALIPAAIEEFLRFKSPVETTMRRFTREPVHVGDVTIPAGQIVFVSLGSANRDRARFADADRLDVARSDNQHVAFGHGVHRCIGAPLARLQGQIAFATLLARMPDLTLAVPEGQLAWRPAMLLRGLVDLPVRW